MEGDFHAALFLYRDGVRGDFSYVPLTVSGSYRIMLLDFSSNGSNIVSKASGFQRTAGGTAQILTGLAAFLACFFLPLPAVTAAQGVQLTAPGRQAIDRFLCDLPYAISLPVTLLLSAILLVYALKGRTKRRLFGAIFFFLVVFLLWMVSNSQLLAAMLIDPRPLWRVSAVFLYLVPVAANFVVYEVLEPAYRRGVRLVIAVYVVFLAASFAAEAFGLPGLSASRPLYYVLLPALELCVFFWLLRSARSGNAYSRALLLPLVTMTVLGVFDGANALLRLTPLPTYVMPVSVYSFLYFILQLIRDQLTRAQSLESRALVLGYRAAVLEERAGRDALTQCRNRGTFEEELPAALWTARRTGAPLSLLLFDIDHFKQFNDAFGHAAGDTVLRGFARTLRAELDKEKKFYRWGGEEFVVLLPGLDLDAAAVFGNHLRRVVASFLRYNQHPITASVGAAIFHAGSDTAQAMFKRADQALYAAKAAGRDCLRVEAPPHAAVGGEAERCTE